MSYRQIAIIVGLAILAIALALVAMALGYGAWFGPRAMIAAVMWVVGYAWATGER
jgi:hypothetical protein